MLTLESLTKVYDAKGKGVRALDGVNLTLEEGDFAVVRGPSGSGKSTLLLTAAGMIRPTEGKVQFESTDLLELSPAARAKLRLENFGFVFQLFHLVPYLSALENVQVPMYVARKPVAEQRRRARELLARVGLSPREKHTPEELSVGERQRVALARALANHPRIIFADEPTGNLDDGTSQQIMEIFTELNRQEHITILMVTHDSRLAAHAQRRLALEEGCLREEGAAAL